MPFRSGVCPVCVSVMMGGWLGGPIDVNGDLHPSMGLRGLEGNRERMNLGRLVPAPLRARFQVQY
jgi:hypothetical protein